MMAPIRNASESLLRIPPDPEAPPGDESTAQIFRAAPSYFQLLVLRWIGRTVVILFAVAMGFGGPVVAMAFGGKPRGMEEMSVVSSALLVLALVVAIAVVLIQLAVLRLNFEKRWYVVTNRSLRVREGVFVVREMTVSMSNIQDVAVMQGPLERYLGIANIRVTTAGGGGSAAGPRGRRAEVNSLHQAWFRGIANAEEVRGLILNRLRALKDSGLGDPDDQAAAPHPQSDAPVLDALRGVLEEARALREAARELRA